MQILLNVVQVVGLIVAVAAMMISLRARRDAKNKAVDVDAGIHSITYREHVLNFHRAGFSVEEIEAMLRRETYRPGMPLDRANAYDNGYAPEMGTVGEILDPLGTGRRRPGGMQPSHADGSATDTSAAPGTVSQAPDGPAQPATAPGKPPR
ncbi:hypothetical protein AB0M20_33575 [Actinoplanes sp. NPDC051633]|jgi:hypothetical protein|uniref:hypothetical protein n=1 Tax=Actinoplanes sp. NPDC051633 TaxID=3155670 RepID=UPI0034323839